MIHHAPDGVIANGAREPASRRPGREKPTLPLAILIFAGKDATAEFDMIHHAPAVIGTLGDGGEDDDEEDDSSEGGYTMEEVAKHNKKGELAILTIAGKDATTEFDTIYPPDVVEKYGPDAIIGFVVSGKAKGAARSALPVATDKGDPVANLEARGDWRMEAFDDTPGVLLVNVRSLPVLFHCGACRRESAHVQGTRRLQRVRLFLLCLHCTGLRFQANIVEECVLLSALLHIFEGLKRTRDQKLSS